MKFQIFDVSHGFFAYMIADNKNVAVFDCGHNEKTNFRPSAYLPLNGCTGIEYLFILNYDQDHISDLPNLRKALPIQILYRNKCVSPEILKNSKEDLGPLTDAMNTMIDMATEYNETPTFLPDLAGISFTVYYNEFPEFTDMNNLSVVVFLYFDGMCILLPGDLEKVGWNKLLENPSFCNELKNVDIFIASHHGRESGYCQDVFKYCSPEIIIISDKEIMHETQNNNYKQHASGIPWNGGPEKRYVLTTRSDGMITITKTVGSGYHISI